MQPALETGIGAGRGQSGPQLGGQGGAHGVEGSAGSEAQRRGALQVEDGAGEDRLVLVVLDCAWTRREEEKAKSGGDGGGAGRGRGGGEVIIGAGSTKLRVAINATDKPAAKGDTG